MFWESLAHQWAADYFLVRMVVPGTKPVENPWFKTTWGRQAPITRMGSYQQVLYTIYSVLCPVSSSKHLRIWELITGHNRSLYMGHRMSIGLLPGTQLLFSVLLFRLALSDAQTIQQAIFIDKQFYCIPKNKSNNGIFYTGDQLPGIMTQPGYRQGACHDPQHWWI